MNVEYKKIYNMTNEEAVKILQTMIMSANAGRANGKTIMTLAINMALSKAIDALQECSNKPDAE